MRKKHGLRRGERGREAEILWRRNEWGEGHCVPLYRGRGGLDGEIVGWHYSLVRAAAEMRVMTKKGGGTGWIECGEVWGVTELECARKIGRKHVHSKLLRGINGG